MELLHLLLLSLLSLAPRATTAWPFSNSAPAPASLPVRRGTNARLVLHDETFTPNIILRLTSAQMDVACKSRLSTVINGTIPGPEIRLPAGETTWIRVYNDMTTQNATVHWHGLSQRAAIFSDGTPGASQWPIAPGHFFDYEVHPEAGDAGTYFYHSHVGFQASTASGPLIVEDAKGKVPYQYDEEMVVHLQDFFHRSDDSIEKGLVSRPFKWSGETGAVLINGQGVARGSQAGKKGCDLPVLEVEPGKTYRMRWIGATALSMIQLGIEKHEGFKIIAADGQYTKPHTEKYMQVSPGQRFDVLFKAKSTSQLNGKTDYLIQYTTKDRPEKTTLYAVLRYKGGKPTITKAPKTAPLDLNFDPTTWAEYALEPLVSNNFPSAGEVTRRVEIYDRQLIGNTFIWRENGDQWNTSTPDYTPGDAPYLVNIYNKGPSAIPDFQKAIKNKGWDPVTYTWPAKVGEVLEIVWYNTGSLVHDNGGIDYHPFHAHGGHYYDIGSGNGTYDAKANEKKLQNYNPVLRDTTNLYRYATAIKAGKTQGWRAWRLRVNDPGVWMIHCHILEHMLMGMQTVWVMGDYAEVAAIPPEDVGGYSTYGGDAVGNATKAPRVLHQFG